MKPSHLCQKAGCYALLMLRCGALLFAGICCLCSFTLAKPSFGQKIFEERISLNFSEVPLEKALQAIADKAAVKIAFTQRVLKDRKPVSLHVEESTLRNALEHVLQGRGLSYLLIDNTLVIKEDFITRFLSPLRQASVRSTAIPHIPLRIQRPLIAQMTVRGTVRDEGNLPLPGVSVVVKGGLHGTATDENGEFQLSNLQGDEILVFSLLGYATREVAISQRELLEISMQLDITGLDEVVVVGYGTQKKSDVTGSVARINMDKTADLPNYNFLQSLQGRTPGLQVTSPDRPGENPGLNVRGFNSISAGNSPLIVVDGIIYNGNLSDLNTGDIATVDILKDASAAAVYGSRAANGVLLITTKTGSTEKPVFSFSTYQGVQVPDKLIDVLDGPGYLQKVLDFREATGLEADPAKIDEYLTVAEAENRKNSLTTDWMDHVLRTGMLSNYHLDVSGRTDKTSYYVSGTYFRNEGIVRNDDFERVTATLNLTNHITEWYSVSIKSLFSNQDLSGVAASLSAAYRQSPYGSFYDELGPGGYNRLPVGDPLGTHPMINTLIDNKETESSLWGLISSNLDFPFLQGLKWTLNASANIRQGDLREFTNNQLTSGSQVDNGIGIKQETKNFDWTVDNILNYRNTFSNRHSVDLTFLYSRESRQVDFSGLRGNNFFTQALGYNNLGLAQVQRIESNFEDQNSIAFMGRINYTFDERYALTLTARRDGYSGFARNNKYATFPSVAFAWTASNEDFFNVGWADYLKLRLSYGRNGNQAIGRYQSLARMQSSEYVFDKTSVTTVSVNSMANYGLSWETTTTSNIGIDFSLFNQKLGGSLDIYSSDTKDLLLRKALPESSGFGEIFTNVGQVHNHGVELSLNSVNLKKENLSWESGIVFSLNRNRIDKLTGQDADGDGVEDDDIGSGWFIGESLFSIFGYKTNGIHQLDDTDIPPGFQPGDFRIVDTDNDGEITPEDRVILGNELPSFTFSVSNTLSFRNFSLYVMINSIQGGRNYYMGNNNATRNVNAPFTTFSERFNLQDVPYWTPYRPSDEYPRVNYNPSLPHPILENRSFVRIQDISLSYNFPAKLLNQINVQSLRLYLSAKNLHTFTEWSGYDPENGTTLANFPFLKSYTLGIDFKF